MIETTELTKIYIDAGGQKYVGVENLNLRIGKGEIVGLFGPNGAGKTTTLNLLSTILKPTKGDAIVNGYDIIKNPLKVRECIGVAGDTPGFYARLSARDNLEFFGKLAGIDNLESKIMELTSYLNIDNVLDRKVGTFSKGMTQKLLLARALLNDPALLMLDEPWSGLSPLAQVELRDLLTEITKERNRTVIISTHNLVQAERIVDRLLIINHGRIIKDSTPELLRREFMLNPLLLVKIDPRDLRIAKRIIDGTNHSINSISEQDGTIEISIKDFEQTPDLVKGLAIEQVRIHEVRELIPSLEEIYIKLVGGNN